MEDSREHEDGSGQVDAEGYLLRGLTVRGKSALLELLRWWLEETSAPTIGVVGSYGGKAWLHIELPHAQPFLNSDTKRSAVAKFVRESSKDPERPWWVIANRDGRVNKVVFEPSREPLPGWFCYVREEFSAPMEI